MSSPVPYIQSWSADSLQGFRVAHKWGEYYKVIWSFPSVSSQDQNWVNQTGGRRTDEYPALVRPAISVTVKPQ